MVATIPSFFSKKLLFSFLLVESLGKYIYKHFEPIFKISPLKIVSSNFLIFIKVINKFFILSVIFLFFYKKDILFIMF